MGRDSLLAPDTSVLARKLSFSEVSADELPLSTLSAPERLRVLVRARPLAAGEAATHAALERCGLDPDRQDGRGRPRFGRGELLLLRYRLQQQGDAGAGLRLRDAP